MVVGVRDVDVTSGVHGHSGGVEELPVAAAVRAPLGQVGPRVGEFLDTVVAPVHDVDVAGGVRRHSVRTEDLPVAAAVPAPLGEIGALAGELLDAAADRHGY